MTVDYFYAVPGWNLSSSLWDNRFVGYTPANYRLYLRVTESVRARVQGVDNNNVSFLQYYNVIDFAASAALAQSAISTLPPRASCPAGSRRVPPMSAAYAIVESDSDDIGVQSTNSSQNGTDNLNDANSANSTAFLQTYVVASQVTLFDDDESLVFTQLEAYDLNNNQSTHQARITQQDAVQSVVNLVDVQQGQLRTVIGNGTSNFPSNCSSQNYTFGSEAVFAAVMSNATGMKGHMIPTQSLLMFVNDNMQGCVNTRNMKRCTGTASRNGTNVTVTIDFAPLNRFTDRQELADFIVYARVNGDEVLQNMSTLLASENVANITNVRVPVRYVIILCMRDNAF
jgi:hypothetical protein